ncbi:hypothetical protein P4O66_015339 [Electrophorus voltai]|uniref:Transposase Tc1-like domain-containing protein n=1 Tax=Electrophorus voltai TaxID=2609070 RepID=A0AAD8Z165_9TELE|nr:hypothetical protein P4O66_015339 [Electrophorus voltai]
MEVQTWRFRHGGIDMERTTVRAIIHKWRKHGTVVNLPRSGRPTKITPRAQQRLIQEVTKDPTTTSKELQASLAAVKTSGRRTVRQGPSVRTSCYAMKVLLGGVTYYSALISKTQATVTNGDPTPPAPKTAASQPEENEPHMQDQAAAETASL